MWLGGIIIVIANETKQARKLAKIDLSEEDYKTLKFEKGVDISGPMICYNDIGDY